MGRFEVVKVKFLLKTLRPRKLPFPELLQLEPFDSDSRCKTRLAGRSNAAVPAENYMRLTLPGMPAL